MFGEKRRAGSGLGLPTAAPAPRERQLMLFDDFGVTAKRLPIAAPQAPLPMAEPIQRDEAGADVA